MQEETSEAPVSPLFKTEFCAIWGMYKTKAQLVFKYVMQWCLSHVWRQPWRRPVLVSIFWTVWCRPLRCSSLSIVSWLRVLVWVERAPPMWFTLNRNPWEWADALSTPSIKSIGMSAYALTFLVVSVYRSRDWEAIETPYFSWGRSCNGGNKS